MQFRIYDGTTLLRTETIEKAIVKIGKLASSDVRLADEQASRVHAVVETSARGEVVILDVGSLTGTFVNGKKVSKAVLVDGDEVVCGKTRIVMGITAPVAAPAPVATMSPMVETLTLSSGEPRPASPTVPELPPVPLADTSPRSIEIAALLGDSVVAVKHLSDPTSGRSSVATRSMFVAGALALFVAVLAFVNGVHVAASNHRRFEAWVDADKPTIDFHSERMSPLWDGLAISGFLSGIALLGWGLARRHGERRSPFFRVGRTAGVEFPTHEVPESLGMIPLVAPSAGKNEFVLTCAAPMKGEIIENGRVRSLSELPAGFPIPRGARVRVELGGNTFLVSSVAAPKKAAGAGGVDRRAMGFALGSAVVHAAVLLLFFLVAPSGSGLSEDDLDATEHRPVAISFTAKENPKAKPEDKIAGGKGDKADPAGGKQDGAEGKAGTEKSTNTTGKIAVDKVNDGPQSIAKHLTANDVRHSYALAVLDQHQEIFDSMTSSADFTNGLDEKSIRGGFVGNEYADVHGWGTGIVGEGPGGGGWNMQTVGNARYGTLDHGAHTGTGYHGPGNGPGGPGNRRPKPVFQPDIGPATTSDIDPNVLRRYIHSKSEQLGYCYQKQLTVNPKLEGTVTAKFTIDAEGKVIVSQATGLDKDVDDCVADVISSIQFPRWGTIINVTKYPFMFHATGA